MPRRPTASTSLSTSSRCWRSRPISPAGTGSVSPCQPLRRGPFVRTTDAEEAHPLDLSLDLVEMLALAPDLAGWDGLGLAVQAYQKRALPLVDWLADLASRARRRLMVRLVKGA